jgi:hypothetical protein
MQGVRKERSVDHDTMTRTRWRRLITVVFLFGGPIVGWLLNADRGLLFGSFVSVIAILWCAVEERKLL